MLICSIKCYLSDNNGLDPLARGDHRFEDISIKIFVSHLILFSHVSVIIVGLGCFIKFLMVKCVIQPRMGWICERKKKIEKRSQRRKKSCYDRKGCWEMSQLSVF